MRRWPTGETGVRSNKEFVAAWSIFAFVPSMLSVAPEKKRSRRLVGFRRKGFGFGVALVAALMLVLQTVAGAVALGQGTPPLDIFGNPLCITSASGHTAPAKSEHPALTACCTLGCNMVSPLAVMPPDGAGLLLGRLIETKTVFLALRPDAATAPEHDPGNPRAPPPLV
jgi:hypothetical protein